MIGRGVAYRKTDKTDLCWSATVKRGSCSSGGVWRTAKRDSTGYCSSPPSTSSSLHGLLFIQPPPRATPSANVQPPLHGHPSTVYCSSNPPHHGVLFNHPSTGTPPPSTLHPTLHTTGSCSTTLPWAPLHRLLFIPPSTGWSYSSTPPRGPVHPAPTGSINRGPVHPEATPRGPVHPPPPGTVHPPPLQRSPFIQRQHRSALVSTSSEGIARSGSVNSHRSIARVQ